MGSKYKYREDNKKLLDEVKQNSDGCSICGWDEHKEILEFHHKFDGNPNQRFPNKGRRSVISVIRWNCRTEILKEELKKCLLLCPNCHTWIHYNRNFQS